MIILKSKLFSCKFYFYLKICISVHQWIHKVKMREYSKHVHEASIPSQSQDIQMKPITAKSRTEKAESRITFWLQKGTIKATLSL